MSTIYRIQSQLVEALDLPAKERTREWEQRTLDTLGLDRPTSKECFCGNPMAATDQVKKLWCKHEFHSKCINSWFDHHRNPEICPTCHDNTQRSSPHLVPRLNRQPTVHEVIEKLRDEAWRITKAVTLNPEFGDVLAFVSIVAGIGALEGDEFASETVMRNILAGSVSYIAHKIDKQIMKYLPKGAKNFEFPVSLAIASGASLLGGVGVRCFFAKDLLLSSESGAGTALRLVAGCAAGFCGGVIQLQNIYLKARNNPVQN